MNLDEFQLLLRRTVLLPVAALVLLVAALGLQLHGTLSALGQVERTDGLLADTQQLLRLAVDQETGLRGYQVTGDPTFLRPYTDAQPQIDALFRNLPQQLVDPLLAADMGQLSLDYQRWRSIYAHPVISAAAPVESSRDEELNLLGKDSFDAIRARCDQMIRREIALRVDRSRRARAQVRATLVFTLLLALAIGVVLAAHTRSTLETVSKSYQKALDDQKASAEAIAFAARRLETTLEAIGDGVIVCDAEGRVERINPVAAALTGWDAKEALGAPLDRVFRIVNEETRQPVENPADKVKRLNTVVGLANHTTLVSRDGAEYHIDDSGAPICDDDGLLSGIVLVFRDITQQRNAEDALLANQKLAMAGRLSATIAHEIHNPLDSIANLLYLLKENPSEADAAKYLDLAEQELGRVTQITRTMLSLYREAKSPVPVELRDLLQGILLLLQPRFAAHGIAPLADMPDAVLVEGFPAELRQVFNNLLMNAVDAVNDGGRLTVCLRTQRPGRTTDGRAILSGAIIEIADNGPGIPPETMGRLFQPFFTTKGEDGTGLGLWVSRGIVEKHGGAIVLESPAQQQQASANPHQAGGATQGSQQGEGPGTLVRVFLPERIDGEGRYSARPAA